VTWFSIQELCISSTSPEGPATRLRLDHLSPQGQPQGRGLLVRQAPRHRGMLVIAHKVTWFFIQSEGSLVAKDDTEVLIALVAHRLSSIIATGGGLISYGGDHHVRDLSSSR
jgi:hypothetical protein